MAKLKPKSRSDVAKLRLRQWIVVGGAVVIISSLAAIARWWPFRSHPVGIEGQSHPTVWQYLFSDRLTLGFLRLGIVFGSMFVVASVIALALAGRWMKALGGMTVDEKETTEERITKLEAQLTETQSELESEQREHLRTQEMASDLLNILDETTADLDEARSRMNHPRRGRRIGMSAKKEMAKIRRRLDELEVERKDARDRLESLKRANARAIRGAEEAKRIIARA